MPNSAGITMSIRIEGLAEMQAAFSRAGVNYRPIFQQAMVKATQKVQNAARAKIVENRTTYQGNLNRGFTVREATAERGVVAESEAYGAAIEFGRRPGRFPPVAPIERWAQVKLGQKGLGFVIARKIAHEGTKAQPFIEPAFRDSADEILGYFKDAAEALVQQMAQ